MEDKNTKPINGQLSYSDYNEIVVGRFHASVAVVTFRQGKTDTENEENENATKLSTTITKNRDHTFYQLVPEERKKTKKSILKSPTSGITVTTDKEASVTEECQSSRKSAKLNVIFHSRGKDTSIARHC